MIFHKIKEKKSLIYFLSEIKLISAHIIFITQNKGKIIKKWKSKPKPKPPEF